NDGKAGETWSTLEENGIAFRSVARTKRQTRTAPETLVALRSENQIADRSKLVRPNQQKHRQQGLVRNPIGQNPPRSFRQQEKNDPATLQSRGCAHAAKPYEVCLAKTLVQSR